MKKQTFFSTLIVIIVHNSYACTMMHGSAIPLSILFLLWVDNFLLLPLTCFCFGCQRNNMNAFTFHGLRHSFVVVYRVDACMLYLRVSFLVRDECSTIY